MEDRERNEILISWLTISVAFAWAFGGGIFQFGDFFRLMPIVLVATGTGFIFHELAHKYVAIRFGAHAEYRMWQSGLVLAVVMAAVFGVVFAAPGAVYIFSDNLSRKQNGFISLAGPLTNIVLGCLFTLAYLFFHPPELLGLITAYGASINFGLATFNLIPIFPLDGSKVFTWNPLVWGLAFFGTILGSKAVGLGFF
ncbi:MAG TPA: site-2 protease family protein [Candidatus Diapherotrites archaeon]|uniref:Site-2 protease family protein n=1 Tax=Candidatus Iainarchaeum sp. TaxID=3101447 RepID=A0A7J4JGF1_9ARCH|nr:site-2 protease family protein [Candidatus Diapherotrites archaeon]HIH16843.1 site-2 protease family protein [Candidatus Diapherotrites archaeon]